MSMSVTLLHGVNEMYNANICNYGLIIQYLKNAQINGLIFGQILCLRIEEKSSC